MLAHSENVCYAEWRTMTYTKRFTRSAAAGCMEHHKAYIHSILSAYHKYWKRLLIHYY